MAVWENESQCQIDLSDYAALWRYSKRRLDSEADYRSFQAFQARLLLKYLAHNRIEVQEKLVLDLGSGVGGYSEEMARHGARVLSMDLMSSAIMLAEGCVPLVGNALCIPIRSNAVQLVFCASLIEHVPTPGILLQEIRRVLRPGGYCYLSFPPFYSPLGGHEYAPFHYLGERWAMRLAGKRSQQRHPEWAQELYSVADNPSSFAGVYDDWGLFRMTVSKARRLIADSSLVIVNQATRYLPCSFIRWPVLGEALTWHAQFLLQKPVSIAARI